MPLLGYLVYSETDFLEVISSGVFRIVLTGHELPKRHNVASPWRLSVSQGRADGVRQSCITKESM
jgi:hypothetical protein